MSAGGCRNLPVLAYRSSHEPVIACRLAIDRNRNGPDRAGTGNF